MKCENFVSSINYVIALKSKAESLDLNDVIPAYHDSDGIKTDFRTMPQLSCVKADDV